MIDASFSKFPQTQYTIDKHDIKILIKSPRQALDPPRKNLLNDQLNIDEECTVHTVIHVEGHLNFVLSCSTIIPTTVGEPMEFKLVHLSYPLNSEDIKRFELWHDSLGGTIGFDNLLPVYELMVHVLAILHGEQVLLAPKDVQLMTIMYSIAGALIWANKRGIRHTLLCLEGGRDSIETAFYVKVVSHVETTEFWKQLAQGWGCNAIANLDHGFHSLNELLFP